MNPGDLDCFMAIDTIFIRHLSNDFPLHRNDFNSLTAKNEISLPEEIFDLFMDLDTEGMLLCVTLCPLIKCPKTAKILAFKGLSFGSCKPCNPTLNFFRHGP